MIQTPIQPFALGLKPPYYAVVFSSQRTASGDADYAIMAARMAELAAQQPGYLGVESARDGTGFGITVSYWTDEASIAAWKRNTEHLEAQTTGRRAWYTQFETRVAKIERTYSFNRI